MGGRLSSPRQVAMIVASLPCQEDSMAIEIRPLSPVLGAEVVGIDLRETLDDATTKEIADAWGKHQVLLFRNQDISVDDQRRFVRIFGEIQPPTSRVDERKQPDI